MQQTYSFALDFKFYWAAARLFIEGQDPYSSVLFRESMATNFGVPLENGYIFPYPPLMLLLVAPYALFPPLVAKILWVITLIGLLLASVRLILNLFFYDNSESVSMISTLRFALLFPPFYLVLAWGQISILILVALLLIYATVCEPNRIVLKDIRFICTDKASILGGVLTTVLLTKPQLALTTMVWLFIMSVLKRDRGFIYGFLIGLVIEVVTVFIINPRVWKSFLMQFPMIVADHGFYKSSSLGEALVNLTGISVLGHILQIAGPVLGVLIAWKVNTPRLAFFLSLLCSTLTVAYIWAHSYIILLPVWLYVCWAFHARQRLLTESMIALQFFICIYFQFESIRYSDSPLYWHALFLLSMVFLLRSKERFFLRI
jgi:hypothetical protein